MKISYLIICFFLALRLSSGQDVAEDFVQCLRSQISPPALKHIFTPKNRTFASVLKYSIQNLRFTTVDTPRPQVIFTPVNESQIQAALHCCKEHGLEIRIRGGGHDFEGQSYVANAPFVIVDLMNFRSVDIDFDQATAWVQTGATQGELHYQIANKSRTLAFTGGIVPSVGVAGFISGGGYGMLARKYGVAADNVIDARFMDVNGEIKDRSTMGEDLFWALRGGGGGNFGIVLEWKVKLVTVPEKVTVFVVPKTLDQDATKLSYRWQHIAHEFPEDLFLRIRFRCVNSSQYNESTIQASFQALFLGKTDELLPLMEQKFPELGLKREDCKEMSWVESICYFDGLVSPYPLEYLLRRNSEVLFSLKGNSDYVTEPIPENHLQGIWDVLTELQGTGIVTDMVWSPYGGKMKEILESQIAYPHRAGNIYEIYEAVYWPDKGEPASQRPSNWFKKIYKYLTPYVSKSPRAAYVNHRNLDLGITHKNTTSEEARTWGSKYFTSNYDRLVKVKTMVDPDNFFRNGQSIPPLRSA